MRSILIAIIFSNLIYASNVTLEDAPLEWLITSTLIEKSYDDHDHQKGNDDLVKNIFETVQYDSINDELIMTSSFKSNNLRSKLINFLSTEQKSSFYDEAYDKWVKQDKESLIKTRMFRIKKSKPLQDGFYYFNHIHTDISQDNNSLKWLKISPEKTFKIIDKFVKRRNTKAVAAFTDHDTDAAFDRVKHLHNERLTTLRGVEWGGKTHMCLIDIKKDWSNLAFGRKYELEETIRQSRSSDGFRIVNHPNRKTPFPYTSWLDADGVEVWNTILEGAPLTRFKIRRSNNRQALQQWTDSLKIDSKYTAISGSDFHFIIPCLRDRSLHYPSNYIPKKDKSKVREYLDQGNLSFLTRPTAPKLNLVAIDQDINKTFGMGSRIYGATNSFKIELHGDFSDVSKRIGGACYNIINSFHKLFTFWKKRRWEVRFYNKEDKLVASRKFNPRRYNSKRHFRIEFNYTPEASDLIRAELWEVNRKRKSIDLLGATNPIYFN